MQKYILFVIVMNVDWEYSKIHIPSPFEKKSNSTLCLNVGMLIVLLGIILL